MPEYTLLAVLSVVGTVVLERRLRVGLFRRSQYWIAMATVFAFQVPVDGWLTKLSAPIVIYAPEQQLGLRWPWDIPVEDFLFGFSMVTLCLVLWERAKAPRQAAGTKLPTDTDTDTGTRTGTGTGTGTGQADTRSSA